MIFSLLCFFVFIFSFAQDSSDVGIRPFPLGQLKGFSQTFYYSSGQQERAIHIAQFMDNAGAYFLQQVAFKPVVTLYILAPQDWKTYAAEPLKNVYGFPHNLDKNRLAIAAEDNDFWRSFLPPVESLPRAMALQVKKAYGKNDSSYSMMPFFDLLALHEMGHSYASQAGLKMHRHWMGELFVNIMLHTYIAEKQPELLPALEVFPAMVTGAGTSDYKFTSLQDFERLYSSLGMGAKNYGWYQCKFHFAAKDIYNTGGKDVMVKLWNALKIHQEEMPDQEFVGMLKREVHPSVADVYLKWK